ncbi:uncharacterized protein LOC134555499 [Prinia subflava]|uniref:uncharacterized protein LOC134555499 n=1 Tax=Prinia subflava TaxID=208062 RepID=UPI002FE2C742
MWGNTALLQSSHSGLGTRVAQQPGTPGQFPSKYFLLLHSSFVAGISCAPLSSRHVSGSACSGKRELRGARRLPTPARGRRDRLPEDAHARRLECRTERGPRSAARPGAAPRRSAGPGRGAAAGRGTRGGKRCRKSRARLLLPAATRLRRAGSAARALTERSSSCRTQRSALRGMGGHRACRLRAARARPTPLSRHLGPFDSSIPF